MATIETDKTDELRQSPLCDYFFSRLKLQELTPEKVSTLEPCNYFMRLKTDHPDFFSWEIKPLKDSSDWIIGHARKEKLLNEEEIKTFIELKERGLDVALLTLREVPRAGLIVVRAPIAEDERASTCCDTLKHRIVGCVIDGSFVDETHMEGEFRNQIYVRNKCWRSSEIKQRLMRLTPEECEELFMRGTRAHRMAILVGFLAGYAPNKAYFEIVKDIGSIEIGRIECGYNCSHGMVEIALPPINYRFNTYTHGQGEKRSLVKKPNEFSTQLQLLCVQGKNALKKEIESVSGVKVRIEEKTFIASHKWEGEKFSFIVVSCPERDKEKLVETLAKLNQFPSKI